MNVEKNSQGPFEALDFQPFTAWFGLRRRVYESERFVFEREREPRAQNSICHTLNPDFPINYLHRLSADDMRTLCHDGSGYYYLLRPHSSAEHVVLGGPLQHGAQFFLMIPDSNAAA